MILTDIEAESILAYWTGGDLKINYNTKWFPSGNKSRQAETDTYIKETYAHLLFQALETDYFRKSSLKISLAMIIILDQFSRHIFRVLDEPMDSTRRRNADKKALKICEETLGVDWVEARSMDEIEITHDRRRFLLGWDEGLSVSQFIFFLMPLRHSATIPRLEYLLGCIEERKKTSLEEINLLDKFRVQTYRRLQVLYDIQKSCCFDGSILEREAFSTTEVDILKNTLVKSVDGFLSKIFESISEQRKSHTLFLSLSGGVDSMVLSKILVLLKHRKHELHGSKNDYCIENIVCIHIDYGNRPESAAEADFVEDWCENNALVHSGDTSKMLFRKRVINEVKRGITDRSEYERVSREIRYGFYKGHTIYSIISLFFPSILCSLPFAHFRGIVIPSYIV